MFEYDIKNQDGIGLRLELFLMLNFNAFNLTHVSAVYRISFKHILYYTKLH